MDTYAIVPATGAPLNPFFTCNATQLAVRTFTLDPVVPNALNLTGLPAGVALAVRVSDTQGNANATAAIAAICDVEPEGIYGNLGNTNHFGIDRTGPWAPAATGAPLRSTAVLTQGTDGPPAGGNDRAPVSLPRIQAIFDQISVTSGEEPDMILMSPLQRQIYGSLFQLTANAANAVQNVSGERATKLDGGFSGLSYGGTPIKTARQVDNGGMIFMKSNTWKLLELQGHGFADLDGTEILRANGIDAWEGFYKWYYNTVCTHPNQNGMLVGLSLTV
jgi:hypothetical protein